MAHRSLDYTHHINHPSPEQRKQSFHQGVFGSAPSETTSQLGQDSSTTLDPRSQALRLHQPGSKGHQLLLRRLRLTKHSAKMRK